MSTLPFFWIDAFTDQKLSGNPCAVILDADFLTANQMRAIAQEMNLSETAFVLAPPEGADFRARYFTPHEELPFAGHPTIAVMQALVQAGRINLKQGAVSINLALHAGIIPLQVSANEGGIQVTMWQFKPQFLRTYPREEICRIYGLLDEDLLAGVPVQTVSTGTPILMIPLANHETLRKVKYADADRYFRLKAQGDFLYAHHFCFQGATEAGRTFARSLNTPPSASEDSFTGSSTGCMAAYLWKYKLLSESQFIAEQGHWMGRPGRGLVERVGRADAIESVKLTGNAVTLIRGQLDI